MTAIADDTGPTPAAAPSEPSNKAPKVRDRISAQRRRRLLILIGAVLLALVGFYLSIEDGEVFYRLSGDFSTEPGKANAHLLIGVAAAITAGALVLALFDKYPTGPAGVALSVVVGICFFLGFLLWSYADQAIDPALTILNPLPETIRLSTPLVLGVLAGVLCERAGIINIAIEGQLLAGAFFASVASSLAYRAEMGLIGGALAGVAIGALLAVFAMRYRVNQVVLGVVLIALATGLTSFLLGRINDYPELRPYLNEPLRLKPIGIPLLADIPLVGPALFDQTVLVYLMYASVVLVTFLLFRTRWGLRVRAVGEHPKAADTVGINVNRVRWQAVLLGGVFAGLGGAFFTVGSTGSFDQGASAGNGFIALAAVIMGRWHPVYGSLAALFFGFTTTLSFQLASLDKIPGELLRASPYLLTVIAVAGFVGRVRPPAADGEPYP